MDLLPVRVAPLAGEAIYSWLEATARTMGLSTKQTLRLPGIAEARRRTLVIRPTSTELERLTERTGVAAARLLAMTLSHYDGTAAEIDATGLVARTFPYGPRSGSRFCRTRDTSCGNLPRLAASPGRLRRNNATQIVRTFGYAPQ
jgi:hypothetical protein